VTSDEQGGYPHPDHLMTHRVTMAALDPAADPDYLPGTPDPAWRVAKVYYHMGFHRARFEALDRAVRAAGLESPYAERLKTWYLPDLTDRLTTHVECGAYFGVRDEALKAHATQVDPDGQWFAVPRAIERAAWPTEDYELVAATVETELPEDDLFAGIA
jgi:mycothiol S-conjugate amidase